MIRRLLICLTVSAGTLVTAGPAAGASPHIGVQSSTAELRFRWAVRDYALRCEERPLRIVVRGGAGWRGGFDREGLRAERSSRRVSGLPGRRTTVTFRNGSRVRRFHLRCLPADFPPFRFRRYRRGGPAFVFMQLPRSYAAIFDNNGVPVWWYRASGVPDNFRLMPDGAIALVPVPDRSHQTGVYEIRKLTGRLIRRVGDHDGGTVDVHDLLRRRDGNYVVGRRVVRDGVDTTAHGGSASSSVIDIEIQEVTPAGRVVWRWNSGDHIGLEETGRWWDEGSYLDNEPYDVVHWNSVDFQGRYMLLSFRHLDAVYKVNRETGRIVWKLGGTPTPKSLEVIGDPRGDYPLGAQHDARFLPDGTISIYDNRSALAQPPRVVRFRVDDRTRTARFVQAFGEPLEPESVCCGSARWDGRSWLVAWGWTSTTGAYDRRGRRVFTLRIERNKYPYRSHSATSRELSKLRLRRAMDVLARAGRAD